MGTTASGRSDAPIALYALMAMRSSGVKADDRLRVAEDRACSLEVDRQFEITLPHAIVG
jgi:hypothetical protein